MAAQLFLLFAFCLLLFRLLRLAAATTTHRSNRRGLPSRGLDTHRADPLNSRSAHSSHRSAGPEIRREPWLRERAEAAVRGALSHRPRSDRLEHGRKRPPRHHDGPLLAGGLPDHPEAVLEGDDALP